MFSAIASYIREYLDQLYSGYRDTYFENIYLAFILPDEWLSDSSDMIDLVMAPLVSHISPTPLPKNFNYRAMFISQLESRLMFNQLRNPDDKSRIASFIHSESRCIMYEVFEYETEMMIKSTYFQLKEDYNLRLLNNQLFIPKIFSTDHHTIIKSFDYGNIESRLKEVLSKYNLLSQQMGEKDSLNQIIRYILKAIVGSVSAYERPECLDFMDDAEFYKLLHILQREIKSLFCKSIEASITYIESIYNSVPFYRKLAVLYLEENNEHKLTSAAFFAFA